MADYIVWATVIERLKHRLRRKGKACLSSFRTRATPHVSKVLDHFPSRQTHDQPPTMGLSKSTRICILLAIDTVFFLIELITGMSGYHPGRATAYTDKASRLCRPFSCPRGRFLPHGQSPSLLRPAASARLTPVASLTMSSPYSSVSGPSRSPTRRQLPKCTPTAYVLISSPTTRFQTYTMPVATRRNPRSTRQRSLPRRPVSLHLP